MKITLAKNSGMKPSVMVVKGRFVDETIAAEIHNLASTAKCTPDEIVAACDVLANPARALAAQLGVAESRATHILSIINAAGAKIAGMKARLAQTSPIARR
jgi:hypothetical protein